MSAPEELRDMTAEESELVELQGSTLANLLLRRADSCGFLRLSVVEAIAVVMLHLEGEGVSAGVPPLLARQQLETSLAEVRADLDKRRGVAETTRSFTIEPGPLADDLVTALEASGMRRLNCEDCGCWLLTRSASNLCPPCREKNQ